MLMKRLASAITGWILAIALSGAAFGATVVVTFDDLIVPGVDGVVPSGYQSLGWNNFGYLDGSNPLFANSGYANSAVSPSSVAFNGSGEVAFFSGSSIDVNSVYLTAAWNDGLYVQVTAFRGSNQIYSDLLTIDTTGPTFVELHYLGVDRVVFDSFGGTPVPEYVPYGVGSQFAMDDLSVTTAPEPAAGLLVGLALLGVASSRRRRM